MKVRPHILASITALLTLLLLWTGTAEQHAHRAPAVTVKDLTTTVLKPTWSEADYQLLTAQTGLFPPALDQLKTSGKSSSILKAQQAYLAPGKIECSPNLLLSRSERLVGTRAVLAPLEDGDILVTPSSHVLGWRNGHAAIVVDAANGTTLEALSVGENSTLQNVSRWTHSPSFIIYRLRGADAATRTAIAQTARRRLNDVPYRLLVGLSAPKRMPGAVSGTQCAHLVWEAFAAYGYDLDANGGPFVTPSDLAASPLLEIKQVYGVEIVFPSL